MVDLWVGFVFLVFFVFSQERRDMIKSNLSSHLNCGRLASSKHIF